MTPPAAGKEEYRMGENRFRSALNGFNRQDVAAYIEGMAERNKTIREERDALEERANALEEQVAELNRAAAESADHLHDLEGTVESKDGQLAAAARREEELNAALAEAKETCGNLQSRLETLRAASEDQAAVAAELETLKAKNAALEQELSSCKEELSRVSGEAEEYAIMKERVLKLELNASRRAVEIEQTAARNAAELTRKAEEQTAGMKQEQEALLRRFKGEFAKLAQEMGFQAELLDQQLSQMVTSLREASGAMDDVSKRLDSLDAPAPEDEAE